MGRAAEVVAARRGVRGTRPEDVAHAYPEVWEMLESPKTPAPPVLLTLDPPAVS